VQVIIKVKVFRSLHMFKQDYDLIICKGNWPNQHKQNELQKSTDTKKLLHSTYTKWIYQHAYQAYSDTDPRKIQYDFHVILPYHQDTTTVQGADPQSSPVSTCRTLACSLWHIYAARCIDSLPAITA